MAKETRCAVLATLADSAFGWYWQKGMSGEEVNDRFYHFLRGNEARLQALMQLPSGQLCTDNPQFAARIDAGLGDLKESTSRVWPTEPSSSTDAVIELKTSLLESIDHLQQILDFGRLLAMASRKIRLIRSTSLPEIRNPIIVETLLLNEKLVVQVCPERFMKAWHEFDRVYCRILKGMLTKPVGVTGLEQ